MNMKDFDIVWNDHEKARAEFLVCCESLYYTIKNGKSQDEIELMVKRCNISELAVRSMDAELKNCFNREATIATLEN